MGNKLTTYIIKSSSNLTRHFSSRDITLNVVFDPSGLHSDEDETRKHMHKNQFIIRQIKKSSLYGYIKNTHETSHNDDPILLML